MPQGNLTERRLFQVKNFLRDVLIASLAFVYTFVRWREGRKSERLHTELVTADTTIAAKGSWEVVHS